MPDETEINVENVNENLLNLTGDAVMADTYSTVDFSTNVLLGKDAVINVGGAKLYGVTSVTLTCEADEVDVSTRDDGGWSSSMPGKKTLTIDLEFKALNGDAGQKNLYTAWSGTNKGVAVTTSNGAATFSGEFAITSLEESQDLDDAITVSVSLKNHGEITVNGTNS